METHLQQQQKLKVSPTKMKARNNNKFVGVRQRPSGRWVAEIKDTIHKIRMWLGTFETAEEAALAYDEAACLLRGSNTRRNFVTHVSANSLLASRIKNLLNSKRSANAKVKKQQSQQSCPSTSQDIDSSTSSCTASPSTTVETNTSAESFSFDNTQYRIQLFKDVYKPYEQLHVGPDRFPFTQELLDLPKNVILSENSDLELSEFERMKVERQISASLYAINGLHEYMETVYDLT